MNDISNKIKDLVNNICSNVDDTSYICVVISTCIFY